MPKGKETPVDHDWYEEGGGKSSEEKGAQNWKKGKIIIMVRYFMKRFRLEGAQYWKEELPGLIWDPEAPFSEASMGKSGAFNVYY